MKINLMILLFGFMVFPVNAEVYKWIDDQGNVHFGDKPPTDAAEEVKINSKPSPVQGTNPADRLRAQQKLINAYREERLKKEEERREAAAKQAERKRACAEARDDLVGYERSAGIYDYDDEGNKIYMSNNEREQFIQDLRDDIRRYCD